MFVSIVATTNHGGVVVVGQRNLIDFIQNLEIESDFFKNLPKVFKNRDALTTTFIPDELPHRTDELKTIAQYFGYALAGSTPPNMLILGSTGIGKTVTVKKVIQMFEKTINNMKAKNAANVVYITASNTARNTLMLMSEEIDPEDRKVWSLSFESAWSRVYDKIRNITTIVVIDEIDKMMPDGSKLLYYLSRSSNVSIIGISNKINFMDMITDARVLSSFNPRKILFRRYNAVQLADILRYRSEMAFYDGVVDRGVIEYTAAKAYQNGGDARYALDLLLYAGDIAVRENIEKITVELIDRAEDEAEHEYLRNCLRDMTIYHLTMLSIMLENSCEPKPLGEIYNKTKEIVKDRFGREISSRRLSDFMKELELMGFVKTVKVGRGRGKGFSWLVEIDVKGDMRDTVREILKEQGLEDV
ncbi:MAG: Cdc6/Cdc18 family protein [Methermicoccaceae archaeon]